VREGDLLLVRGGDNLQDRIIRFGTHSVWTHVAVFVGEKLIVEALSSGISIGRSDRYDPNRSLAIDTNLSDEHRRSIGEFALSRVGERYGSGQIAAITLAWLTHGKLFFGVDNTETCSSLVARCLEHAGLILPKSPELYSPADIAAQFNVLPKGERSDR
jgi:uncharacterized protein YycO